MGISKDATQEEIKSRYRTLAKRHHPDVDRSKDAAQKFREISDANRILSDPMARSLYDAEILIKSRAQSQTRSQASQSNATTPSTTKQTSSSQSGQTSSQPRGTNSNSASAKQQPKKSSYRQEAAELANRGQREFNRMHYREAEVFCRNAIKIDRRNLVAHEILGEILEKRGQKEEALSEFSVALQLDPTNFNLQRKFEKMTGRKSSVNMSGHAAYVNRSTGPTKSEVNGILLPLLRLAACIALLIVIVLMLIWTARHSGGAVAWSPLLWNPALLTRMVVVGISSGLIIGLSGKCGQITSALQADIGNQSPLFPIILLLVSVFSIYIGFGMYALVGRTTKGMSTALFTSYLATVIAVGAFACADIASSGPILIFGGSLVFPAMIVGWRATGS